MSLTNSQVEAFFDRIDLPQQIQNALLASEGSGRNLANLTVLQRAVMTAVPFENTSLHYSRERLLEMHQKGLYNKIVVRREGGTCFQVARFFLHVLRFLGFTAYPTGSRLNVASSINATGPSKLFFGDWAHMILIVTLDSQKYLVDVSLGPNAPTSPVLLHADREEADTSPRVRRLIRTALPQNTDSSQAYWRLQFKPHPSHAVWADSYAFQENEFLMGDYDTIHLSLRLNRKAWFLFKVMAFRVLLDEQGEPRGFLMLFEDRLRKVWMGKGEIIAVFKTELDRIKALQEYFGISLDEDEAAQIAGTVAAIKPSAASPSVKQVGQRHNIAELARL